MMRKVAALFLATVAAAPAAAQDESIAKIFAAEREIVSATVERGAVNTISVALTARFATEGLTDDEADTLVAVVPYVLARCIAADRAVESGVAALEMLGAEGDAKVEPWNGETGVSVAGRYGFRLGDDLTPDDQKIFEAQRMRDDCAANDSIPSYDVIGGEN
jgi:hypothetical protein